jgi:hypothetical protein
MDLLLAQKAQRFGSLLLCFFPGFNFTVAFCTQTWFRLAFLKNEMNFPIDGFYPNDFLFFHKVTVLNITLYSKNIRIPEKKLTILMIARL